MVKQVLYTAAVLWEWLKFGPKTLDTVTVLSLKDPFKLGTLPIN